MLAKVFHVKLVLLANSNGYEVDSKTFFLSGKALKTAKKQWYVIRSWSYNTVHIPSTKFLTTKFSRTNCQNIAYNKVKIRLRIFALSVSKVPYLTTKSFWTSFTIEVWLGIARFWILFCGLIFDFEPFWVEDNIINWFMSMKLASGLNYI
jgi:fatty acid desaturase